MPERLASLESIQLEAGCHCVPGNGIVHACVMEAVSYIAGEPWSDHPQCASPVIAAFLRAWNEALPDEDRDRLLKPLIPRLVGTRESARVETKRSWMAADWLVREYAPAFLRLAGLSTHAETLEGLVPLTTAARARAAQAALTAAGDAARDAARAAARDAARAAAWVAAWDVAWAAAWAAAKDAAWAVAGTAAWDAAWAAVGDAAWATVKDDARDALSATVQALQGQALLLLERMIEVT